VVVEVSEGSSSTPLVEALGFEFGMAERRSRLQLDQLDRALMRQWIVAAQDRASDYELLFFPERLPDDLVIPYAEMLRVMNTAPRDNLDEEDETFTPEDVRETEDNFAKVGAAVSGMIARHRPTGQLAGFTNMTYSRHNPSQLWQWGTGVEPTHQNKGLGRWLKAAMIEELTTRFPEAERVDTFNAGSNEPMLNINIAMGFKPIAHYHVYQGTLDSVDRWIGGRG
jgi:RimJ/RimL family protein N-acetyltransferase